MGESKRTSRSKEERIADIDKSIKYHMDCISKLESKRIAINSSKTRRPKGIKRIISESGLTEDAIATALGFDSPMALKEVIERASKENA